MPPPVADANKDGQLDRLTNQLYYLPSIIARLGLGIAEAQKELNAQYLLALARVLELARGGQATPLTPEMLTIVGTLLPPRYQFTETTIDFAADLSERKSLGGDVGIGVGVGAFMVSAGFSLSYGYDYRAAARITSVVHAHGFDASVGKSLLDRAAVATGDKPTLPSALPADADIAKRLEDVRALIAPKQP